MRKKYKTPVNIRKYNANWRKKNPGYPQAYRERNREKLKQYFRTLYKIKKELSQSGATRPKPQGCEICGDGPTVVFDHDHKTDKFRGWLCHRHNRAIGLFHDSIEELRKAADYLECA